MTRRESIAVQKAAGQLARAVSACRAAIREPDLPDTYRDLARSTLERVDSMRLAFGGGAKVDCGGSSERKGRSW